MRREELVDEIAEMLREKHGDLKKQARATNLTADAGRRSIAEDVIDLLLQIAYIKVNKGNELIIALIHSGGDLGTGG